jgi:hypothetical protein
MVKAFSPALVDERHQRLEGRELIVETGLRPSRKNA